ncbi:MAG: ABC transporter substrate-binding protein [Nitrososphaerota archaeon]|nr:ABC transporter substrate-binding protein [Candidatus Geocrenenecus dongiae]
MYKKALSKVLVAIIIIVIAVVLGVGLYYVSLPTPPTVTPTTITTPTPSQTPSVTKKLVIYASLSEMTTADPSTEFSNSILWLCLVYEPLLWYDPLENKFIPALAERWESSKDGTVWTFYLRKGVVFHDGTPFTAEAVKKSIERTIELGQGAAFIWDPVEKIEIVDDYTVTFILKYPAALDSIAASSYGAWIFSPRTPNTPEWFNQGNDAGSGPYKLVKWDPENEVILEKFEDWWGWKLPSYEMASPKAPDIFIVKIVKDAVTQERLVVAGEIDIAEYIPLEDVDRLKADPNLKVVIKPSFQNLLMLINTKKPPLDNVLVRRAIAHAIPYEDIVKIARSGLAKVASGPVPTGMPGHFEDFRYRYDLEEARRLLAEAGYPTGLDKTLVLVYTAGDVYEQRTSELIAASLSKIGIKVDIRPMSWEEQWALAQSGWENPEMAQDLFIFYWWPTYITPFDFLYNMFHSGSKAFNLCYYENPEFERLIEEAVSLEGVDKSKALELYYKAQKILYEDVPAVPLWDMIEVRVGRAYLGNLEKAVNPAYPTVIFAQVLSVEK